MSNNLYSYSGDVDNTMFLLKMIDNSSNSLGLMRSVTIIILYKSINAIQLVSCPCHKFEQHK